MKLNLMNIMCIYNYSPEDDGSVISLNKYTTKLLHSFCHSIINVMYVAFWIDISNTWTTWHSPVWYLDVIIRDDIWKNPNPAPPSVGTW